MHTITTLSHPSLTTPSCIIHNISTHSALHHTAAALAPSTYSIQYSVLQMSPYSRRTSLSLTPSPSVSGFAHHRKKYFFFALLSLFFSTKKCGERTEVQLHHHHHRTWSGEPRSGFIITATHDPWEGVWGSSSWWNLSFAPWTWEPFCKVRTCQQSAT